MRRRIAILFFAFAGGVVYAQPPAVTAAAKPAATEKPAATALPADTAAPAKPASTAPDPKDPRSWIWSAQLGDFSDKDYRAAVDALFADFEKRFGRKLEPGTLRRAGLKVNTNTAGLTTPPPLVRAVIEALEARGFKAAELFIVDRSESRLHDAGFLPLNTREGEGTFDGVQVIALERGRYYSLKWSYDSNVAPDDEIEQMADRKRLEWAIDPNQRQSLLPVPLLVAVDFWINLPVGINDDALGVSGTLVDATLYSSSNTGRFFDNPQWGNKAVAEMAAVPELQRGWVFSLFSLERYQFAGGPIFNSFYTRSEPVLLMSPNPVILDQLLFDRLNAARRSRGLEPIDHPAYLDNAVALHLGTDDPQRMFLQRVP